MWGWVPCVDVRVRAWPPQQLASAAARPLMCRRRAAGWVVCAEGSRRVHCVACRAGVWAASPAASKQRVCSWWRCVPVLLRHARGCIKAGVLAEHALACTEDMCMRAHALACVPAAPCGCCVPCAVCVCVCACNHTLARASCAPRASCVSRASYAPYSCTPCATRTPYLCAPCASCAPYMCAPCAG